MPEKPSFLGRAKAILKRPFPPPRPVWRALGVALGVGTFIGLFLWYFEPFGIGQVAYAEQPGAIAGFGVITTAVFLLANGLLPIIARGWFTTERWTVGRQFLYYAAILMLIATANGLYINHLRDLSFSWINYAWILRGTIALGIIPITLLLLCEYTLRLRRSLRAAASLRTDVKLAAVASDAVLPPTLRPLLDLAAFTHAESFGNYLRFHHLDEPPRLHRMTMRRLCELTADVPQLQRCHRGFFVNLSMVTDVGGNAQGLKLQLRSGRNVTVARAYVPDLRAHFAARPLSAVT